MFRGGRCERLLEIGQEPRAPAKPGQLLCDAFGVRCALAHEPGSRECRGEAEQARGRVHERHSVAEPAQAVTDRTERKSGGHRKRDCRRSKQPTAHNAIIGRRLLCIR